MLKRYFHNAIVPLILRKLWNWFICIGPLRYLDEYYSSASVERDQSNIDTMSQEVLSARSDRSSTLSPVVSHQLPRRKERRPMSGVDSSVPRKSLSPMNMKKTTVPVATETMPTQEEILVSPGNLCKIEFWLWLWFCPFLRSVQICKIN